MPKAEKNAAKATLPANEMSDLEETDTKSECCIDDVDDSETCKWLVEETEKLIDMWYANVEQINARRNENIMQKIAAILGGTKDSKQVRLKVKKLRAKFIRERARKQLGKPIKWRYYQKINRLNLVPNLKEISDFSSPQTESVVQTTNDCSVVPNKQIDSKALVAGDGTTRRVDSEALVAGDSVIKKVKVRKERTTEVKQAINNWRVWNTTLTYPLSEQGLHQLISHGFCDPTHIQLLVGESLEPLQLIYHDKLALKHALANSDVETHYQVINGTHGTLIEVEYMRKESDAAADAIQAENSEESPSKEHNST